MVVTRESRRAWWAIMLGAWTIAAALVLAHTIAVRDYIALLDDLGGGPSSSPTSLRRVIPARFADAQMWLRHALETQEAGRIRLHTTTTDNAPFGREVHWSSAMSWVLRGAARTEAMFGFRGAGDSSTRNSKSDSGISSASERGPAALERALLWLNAPLFLSVLIGFSAWVGRRAGAGAGLVVALAMIGHPRFYEGFMPAYVDHHGLVTAATFGLVVGFAFAGGGWWRAGTSETGSRLLPVSPESARRAASISAVCGATGLWLSAAAVLPVIAVLGASAVAVSWWRGRRAVAEGCRFEPAVLRRWGRVGAAGSLVFYFLEYAPADFGLRLEVNHPLYAAAWWGGAEVVAGLVAWRMTPEAGTAGRIARRLALPLLAIVAVPVVILIGGTKVFLVADPFVGELRHYVTEGKSLPATIRELGFQRVTASVVWVAILLPAGWLLVRSREDARLVLGLLTAVTLALVGMSVLEMRWWMSASAAQIALGPALFAALPVRAERTRWWWIGVAMLSLFVFPAARRIAAAFTENRAHAVTEVDLFPALYRDIAGRLRESQPEGEIILLSNPNASAGISYYGRFKSLGTLFWENAPGLRAAAEIFSAESEDEALSRLRARQVTHIAMLSAAHFLDGYHRLLHPGASAADAKRSFGQRLRANQCTAVWLQPVPYRIPGDLKLAGTTVRLYRVAVDQTEPERLYHTLLAQSAAEDVAAAEETWRNLHSRIPRGERAAVAAQVGQGLYELGLHADAVRIYRSVLEAAYDPGITNTYAWVLATSDDPAVRDGRLALKLMEPLMRNAPDDPAVLSSFAAACAEVGRFDDAVRAAERALAMIRAAGNQAVEPLLQRRLDSYRARQPWRQ